MQLSLARVERGQVSGASEPVVWWSFTKTLIATAVLRLVEEGALALDAPLSGHIFTVRQVLGHRAGLGDYGGQRDYAAAVEAGLDPWDDETFLARVSPDRLLFAPGEGWSYSNIGYGLLRREIERRCDAPFADALSDLVLAPLGLERARVATTTSDVATTAFPPPPSYHPGWVFHGVVVGPVAEAALALDRILAGAVLSGAMLEEMRAEWPVAGAIPGRPWRRAGYGLGLMVGEMEADGEVVPVAGHSAGGPGSTGAIYAWNRPDGTRAVAAAFSDACDDGATAEREAVRCLTSGR